MLYTVWYRSQHLELFVFVYSFYEARFTKILIWTFRLPFSDRDHLMIISHKAVKKKDKGLHIVYKSHKAAWFPVIPLKAYTYLYIYLHSVVRVVNLDLEKYIAEESSSDGPGLDQPYAATRQLTAMWHGPAVTWLTACLSEHQPTHNFTTQYYNRSENTTM